VEFKALQVPNITSLPTQSPPRTYATVPPAIGARLFREPDGTYAACGEKKNLGKPSQHIQERAIAPTIRPRCRASRVLYSRTRLSAA
jgi:hypothetical protein